MYVHLLKKSVPSVILENFAYKKITNIDSLKNKTKVQTVFEDGTVTVTSPDAGSSKPDVVIVPETKG